MIPREFRCQTSRNGLPLTQRHHGGNQYLVQQHIDADEHKEEKEIPLHESRQRPRPTPGTRAVVLPPRDDLIDKRPSNNTENALSSVEHRLLQAIAPDSRHLATVDTPVIRPPQNAPKSAAQQDGRQRQSSRDAPTRYIIGERSSRNATRTRAQHGQGAGEGDPNLPREPHRNAQSTATTVMTQALSLSAGHCQDSWACPKVVGGPQTMRLSSHSSPPCEQRKQPGHNVHRIGLARRH